MSADSWKVGLPCSKAEAEALAQDITPFALLEMLPVLVTKEERDGGWRLDAYFDARPSDKVLELLAALVPSAGEARPSVERVAEQDWVTLSQQGLEPIRAGRFYVHTPTWRDSVPAGAVAFEIAAGRAFGTGQHETTGGCLIALDGLKRSGASFANVADIGTGTGLLAFAALRLWPAARAIASDVDPVAIEVAAENAAVNGIGLGRTRGRLELVAAAGLDHARLRARAPYDLVVANILAGPLIELAPAIAPALALGGTLVLAGLLDQQAEAVTGAYRREGLMPSGGIHRGEWPTLMLRKRRRIQRPGGRRSHSAASAITPAR